MSFLNPNIANPAAGGRLGTLQFAGNGPASCNCTYPYKAHYLNFEPRIGLATSWIPRQLSEPAPLLTSRTGERESAEMERTLAEPVGLQRERYVQQPCYRPARVLLERWSAGLSALRRSPSQVMARVSPPRIQRVR